MKQAKNPVCPECGTELSEDTILFVQTGTYVYKVRSLAPGDIEYDLEETHVDESYFTCGNCGEELPYDEGEIIEIIEL
jgi:predicted RNA-binding Zn-ribbon protein involved in translation (DUF1610 family)